jgi:signal peptidase I
MSDSADSRTHRAARRRAERQPDSRDQARGKVTSGQGWKATAWEWLKAIAWALAVALLIKQFLFQAFTIPTGSMKDTLLVHDFLFVNKFLYGAETPERITIPFVNKTIIDDIPHVRLPGFRDPEQGDIIVFAYPEDPRQDYIKRCVAVAGDTVELRDGILRVNGAIYESNFADRDGDHSCIPDWRNTDGCPEPHSRLDRAAMAASPLNRNFGPYTVPEDHIFMMGDNRYNSQDSRYWGPLPVDNVRGKAEIIYWSYERNFLIPRVGRLLKIIDLPPDRRWVQPVVRIVFLLVVAGIIIHYRRRDRKDAQGQEG